MVRTLAVAWTAAHFAFSGQVQAALIVNPAQPITERINVNLIATADDDGSDSTAGMFGSATQQAQVFSLVDVIFAQAGVDVEFAFRPGAAYNSSFARTGAPGANNPRPQSDLNAIRNAASAAGGVLSGDPNTINVSLVSIVPGFSALSANATAGLATIGGNGVAYYSGENLLDFAGGREILASVLSHELGHNLGLSHNTISENLMQSGGGGEDGERLSATQIQTILTSRFTVPAPAPTLPGDFNDDDRVDGSDFLAWQRGGSPTPLSAGDLTLWRTRFGSAGNVINAESAALRSVPEATGLSPGLIGLAWLARRLNRPLARSG
jgi:hypothetical protein